MDNYKHNFAICIGRQLGSGGRNVALAISRKLNIGFYDKEIISQAAKDSGLAPEYFEKVDEKPSIPFLAGYVGIHAPFYQGCCMDTESYLDNHNLFRIQSRTIEMLAEKGPGVFVGRCADYILREHPHLLTVFITAELEDRIRRLSTLLSITSDEALAMIRECDKKRAEYYNYYTFKKWGDSSSYQLCLSTSLLGEEETAERIVKICKETILAG